MRAALVVATNTFRENRRDRVLYVLVIFAVVLIAASTIVSELSPFDSSKILLDVGQAAMALMGSLIAVFLGIGLVSREIERRTIYVIVSKPIGRVEFLLGKVLGLALTLSIAVAIMAVMVFGVAFLYGARPGLAIAQSVALIWVQLVLLVAMSVAYATFTSSTPLAAMFALSTWVIGMGAGGFKEIAERSGTPAGKAILHALWWLLPDFGVLDVKARATYGIPLPAPDFLLAAGYGLAWTAVFLCVSVVIFSRRDFR